MQTEKRRQFEALVLPVLDDLYSMAWRICGSSTQAEDLVQETLLRAFRGFEDFRLEEFGIKPWLFKILHNLYFRELAHQAKSPRTQDRKHLETIPDRHADAPPELDVAHMDWEEFDERIKHSVEVLPPESRMVLLLWALERLSYQEIARICDIPVGTVMSRLHRARRQLTGHLAGYLQTHRHAGSTAGTGGKPSDQHERDNAK